MNNGEPDTPIFVEAPFIKSITIGHRVDEICQHLIMDICKKKSIPCYVIRPAFDSFVLNRELLDEDPFDEAKEQRYIEMMGDKIQKEQDVLLSLFEKFNKHNEAVGDNEIDANLFLQIIQYLTDFLSEFYFLHYSLNRFYNETDNKEALLSLINSDKDKEQTLNDLRKVVTPYKFILLKLREQERITDQNYKKANKQLSDIQTMVDNIASLLIEPCVDD